MPNHVHMLLSIPTKYAVSQVVKVRFRGLNENTAQQFTLLALSNRCMACRNSCVGRHECT